MLVHTTQTGYKLEITPLPVYYLDFIDQVYPLRDLPKRGTVNPAGELVEFDYKPPKIEPLPGDDDYDIFVGYMAVLAYNESLNVKRLKAKTDFLLLSCVKILDGEYNPDNEDWEYILEASFDDGAYKVPKHKGQRLLAFLKGIVIRTLLDKDLIFAHATTPEVEMQGIIDALHSFQDTLG